MGVGAPGFRRKTLANVYGVLHKALADGVKSGLLARNPADAIAPPRASRAQNDAWTVAELRRFLEHVAGDRLYSLWTTFATLTPPPRWLQRRGGMRSR